MHESTAGIFNVKPSGICFRSSDAESSMILDEPDQVVDAELPDQVVDAELPDQMVDAELLDQVVDAEFPMILDDPFTFDLTSILSRYIFI